MGPGKDLIASLSAETVTLVLQDQTSLMPSPQELGKSPSTSNIFRARAIPAGNVSITQFCLMRQDDRPESHSTRNVAIINPSMIDTQFSGV